MRLPYAGNKGGRVAWCISLRRVLAIYQFNLLPISHRNGKIICVAWYKYSSTKRIKAMPKMVWMTCNCQRKKAMMLTSLLPAHCSKSNGISVAATDCLFRI
mmetsp:Transcript_2518/g.4541  ORF Transcript_2518/g.4541 Transcript_2518/m.4541 type:complete len:101 (-) Transcript_2518:113-415(-)